MLFAVLHLYWAAGGNAGLASSAGADLAEHRPWWFVTFGLWGVALVLCVGAVFSLCLTRLRPPAPLRGVMLVLGYLGGAALLLRGVLMEVVLVSGAGGIAASVGPLETTWSLILWNPWFVVGGVAVTMTTRRFHRVTKEKAKPGHQNEQ
ncbi:DUF3995 domain-containing protein [Amycolatopsis sp. CA-230715]|uniref:DUF3995 domain-containing protein n=1 Tax=Amycolatopsis sp. CA-230715 TaxID=2745196 RepID=UPI001C021F02|nr:DUF3995 domain-containing protein [Amycolatopsis sp. CA-230715]QWF82326.1 hypothetical protein HUW46_05763 [Amycolatopsis sp. CA-230715]